MSAAGSDCEAILDSRFSILDSAPRALALFAIVSLLYGCSSEYHIRLADGRSVCNGPLFLFGWADPPLIPGTRLIDAPSGSRLVLWNEADFEAIVDIGETCPVLVREGDGARAPTEDELSLLAALFPGWPFEASTRSKEYGTERRLERRFPSHIRSHAESLDGAAAVAFALGETPAGWLDLGGRALALSRAAGKAAAADLPKLVDRALRLSGENRTAALGAILSRSEVKTADLLKVAGGGEPELAVVHSSADESVCLAALDAVSKEPLSADRRRGLEKILDSAGVTPKVRERVLEVPLGYPADRDAIRVKAAR
jgi:hypothetical protein